MLEQCFFWIVLKQQSFSGKQLRVQQTKHESHQEFYYVVFQKKHVGSKRFGKKKKIGDIFKIQKNYSGLSSISKKKEKNHSALKGEYSYLSISHPSLPFRALLIIAEGTEDGS